MVSYYNPAVAMFSHSGSGHYHPHYQASGGSNPYFAPPYGGYPAAHPHAHAHHVRHGGSGAGSGGTVVPGVSSTSQFSPKISPDFNYNHQYPHQFAHMSPDSAAIAAAASASPWSHTGAGNVYNTCHRTYDEWSQRTQHHQVNHHAASLHSFYSHQQPSPPSSNPSPNPQKLVFGGGHGHESGESAGGNSSNQYNNGGFKSEFGPLSGGGGGNSISQENPSLESMRQGGGRGAGEIGSSVTTSIATPHSPDSGMAISDGVSSSGSPATGMGGGGGGQHCFGDGGGANLQLASPGTGLNENMIEGSGDHMSNNLNQQSIHNQQRPAQARSPFEWMKKPAYSVSSNSSNGKTRTKDKYRVVYTDTQRLELEKEFHYNRYITIRRKAELASILGLSERQVKIWFQNRRAKERKVVRKREEMIHREKIATMVHMQSAVAGATGMGQVNNNYGL